MIDAHQLAHRGDILAVDLLFRRGARIGLVQHVHEIDQRVLGLQFHESFRRAFRDGGKRITESLQQRLGVILRRPALQPLDGRRTHGVVRRVQRQLDSCMGRIDVLDCGEVFRQAGAIGLRRRAEHLHQRIDLGALDGISIGFMP